MRHFSIKFNVTELFAFASQPGSGFSKGTVSCDLKKKTQKHLHTILDPFQNRQGFGSCRNHSQHLCTPCLSLLCQSPFLSFPPSPAGCRDVPSSTLQMVAVFQLLLLPYGACNTPLQSSKGWVLHPHLGFSLSFSLVLPLCLYHSACSHCGPQASLKPIKKTTLRARSKIWLRCCKHSTVPSHPQY